MRNRKVGRKIYFKDYLQQSTTKIDKKTTVQILDKNTKDRSKRLSKKNKFNATLIKKQRTSFILKVAEFSIANWDHDCIILRVKY